MAGKKSSYGFIIGTARGLTEARRSFEVDDRVRSASKTLLKPDEVAGEYDISRGLKTMLGSPDGKPVTLTHEHLRQFAYTARQVTANIQKKGVPAQTVIDLSEPIDRQRAQDEIRTAMPISTMGHTVRFMTNAGPHSDRQRHYVVVNFLNFLPTVAEAIKVEKAGQKLSNSPLQISCSCGRWRYWLAYLATKVGYNSGHVEDAFPKIRNPGLSGIACKHILRVMVLIRQSPYMKQYLTTMVRKARETVEAKRADEKVADTRAAAEALGKESWRQRRLTTSEQRKVEADKAKQRRELTKAVSKAVIAATDKAKAKDKAATKAVPAPKPKKTAAATRRAAKTEFEILSQRFEMTPEQFLALLTQD